MSINTEEVVQAYLAVRNERARIKAEYETADDVLKADIQQLESVLLTVCNDIHADSIKTGYGTVIRSVKERFYTNDWDNFRNFVVENNAVDLLERRIHQGNFKQFLADHVNDGLPPGVNVMREYGISVRKSTNEDSVNE